MYKEEGSAEYPHKRMNFQGVFKEEEKGFAGDLHKKRMDFQDICIVKKGLPELHRRGWICKGPNIRRDFQDVVKEEDGFTGTCIRRRWIFKTLHRGRGTSQKIAIEEEGFAGDLHKKRMDFQDIYMKTRDLQRIYVEEEGFAGDLHKRRMDFQDVINKGAYIIREWICRGPT
jgi:hypothetical protein